jgi:hypothetical protein
MQVIEHPPTRKATQEIQMKKLLTVSAVILLMIFTAGLSTASAASAVFFGGAGNLFSVTDAGETATTTATITVNEAGGGLFYGTITIASPATTIDFSAVLDSKGVYTFNGQIVEIVSPAPAASVGIAFANVEGAFTISKHKNPVLAKHAKKVLAAAIEFKTLGTGESYAGLLFNEAE